MQVKFLHRKVINNLRLVLNFYKFDNYKEAADFLDINYSTFRSWFSYKRKPSLHKLDLICDKLKIPTYLLFMMKIDENLIEKNIGTIINNSRDKFKVNLEKAYYKNNKYSWRERELMFSGLLSFETLKSYQRNNNYIMPTIDTLEEICTYLGEQPYKILGGDNHEK